MNRTTPFHSIAPIAALLAAALTVVACNENPSAPGPGRSRLRGVISTTPPFVKPRDVPGLELSTLISSDDSLPESPGFVFGGTADGSGVVANADGSYTMLVNHESSQAVSRIILDTAFRPAKGDYVLTADDGRWRLCSGTMMTPKEHGYGPLFLSASEGSIDGMIHGVNPFGPRGQSATLPALGRWSAEQAVPLVKAAYPGRTVILIGEDESGASGGQVAMYVSDVVGDLENGSLYVLARADFNHRETDIVPGVPYPVVFRRIDDQRSLSGSAMVARCRELDAIRFGRVEDVDYRKGAGHEREVYFNVTGQDTAGDNADRSRTRRGRVYRLMLDANDPTRGVLTCVLDGDDPNGPAREFQNPDNICVTENYAYIAEDAVGYDITHDAYVYRYEIATGAVKVALQMEHHRDIERYNVCGPSGIASWEYGALVDVSDLLGVPGTFILNIQSHTWRGVRYKNPDGGAARMNEDQASAIVLIRGLPR